MYKSHRRGKEKNIVINGQGIEKELGVPVVLCAAISSIGIKELKEAVYKVTTDHIKPKLKTVKYQNYIEEKIKSIQPLVEKTLAA